MKDSYFQINFQNTTFAFFFYIVLKLCFEFSNEEGTTNLFQFQIELKTKPNEEEIFPNCFYLEILKIRFILYTFFVMESIIDFNMTAMQISEMYVISQCALSHFKMHMFYFIKKE